MLNKKNTILKKKLKHKLSNNSHQKKYNGGILKKLLVLMILLISTFLFSQDDMQEIYFNVSVTGIVAKPGVYHLPPTSRISEAIMAAEYMGTEVPTDMEFNQMDKPALEELDFDDMYLPEEESTIDASTRNIILKRRGESIHLDMESFYRLGNIDQNPYIQDGDVIFIPPIKKRITIAGEINQPGLLELKAGDTLDSIIKLSQGFSIKADPTTITITRLDKSTGLFNSFIINYNDDTDYTPQPDDFIRISPIENSSNDFEVSIYGNVKNPGFYPINQDKTTLLEILNMVGIEEDKIDLTNSFVQRTNKNDIPNPEFERLKLLRPEEMTYAEYEYFKAELKNLKGKFSLDLYDLYYNDNETQNITMKDGDFIYLSGKVNTVIVKGNVKNPGLITYKAGENYLYYIDAAGGFSWQARKSKIRIIRNNSNEWIKPQKKMVLYPGDTILVPEKKEIKIWGIIKETVVVLSQIGTLILVIDNATSK